MTTTNLSSLIDSFGDLKADSADLELKIQALKDALADLEKGSYEGERYRLTVVEANVERTNYKDILQHQKDVLDDALETEAEGKTVDWRKVAQKLVPSRQLLDAHTTKTTQRSLRVGARNGKKVAA